MNKRIYIRYMSVSLILTFCLGMMPVAYGASIENYDGVYEASLEGETAHVTNCEVTMGTDTTVTTETHGGKTGWRLFTTSTSGGGYTRESAYMYIDISDTMLFRLNSSTNMKLSVTYYDSGEGRFSVGYDSRTARHEYAGHQTLGNTGTWKTAEFVLKRPYFGNGISGNDIMIAVVTDYMSPKVDVPVIISDISVTRGDEDPLGFEISSTNTGNIFYGGQVPQLTVTARNESGINENFDITYTITNRYSDEVVYSETENIRIISKNIFKRVITIDDLPYGIYDLSINAFSENGYESMAKTSFSRVNADYSDSLGRADFGAATHMYSRDGDTGKTEMPVMARAGFGMIRESIGWNEVETKKGEYFIPAGIDSFLDNAEKNGLEPLMIIGQTNKSIYPTLTPFVRDDDGVTAAEAEQIFCDYLDAYYDYCYNLAYLLGDRVTYYEIGNEYNIVSKNTSFPKYGIKNKAQDYARIMETAYNAVKAANPDAILVGGVLAEMPDENKYYEIPAHYVEELYSYGAGAWMDCLSVHFYKSQMVPGTSKYKAMEELRAVRDIITANADVYGDKELWVTEYGWTVPGHADTEWEQAENLVKSQVLFARDSLPDRSFWYMFEGRINRAVLPGSSGYAMVESFVDTYTANHTPGRAKGAYLAAAYYNKLIKNFSYVENKSTGNKQEHVFLNKTDDTTLRILWSLSGEETFTIPVGNDEVLIACDMFGNISYPDVTDGICNITIGTEPVYVMPETNPAEYEPSEEDVHKIRLRGSVLTDCPTEIAVAVLYPGKTIKDFNSNPILSSAYIGQFVTDSEGRYEEIIKLGGQAGTYTLLYSMDGENIGKLSITLDKMPYSTELVITQNGVPVDGIAEFVPSLSFNTDITLRNDRGISGDCVFVTAFYKGNTLVDCKTIKGSVGEQENVKTFTNDLPLNLPQGAQIDKIKLIMIDSFDTLVPLASVKTIQ